MTAAQSTSAEVELRRAVGQGNKTEAADSESAHALVAQTKFKVAGEWPAPSSSPLTDVLAAEAAGVDPVLLADAVSAMFGEITTHQANGGSTLMVTNYIGPVTVHQHSSKATKPKVPSNQARHPKEHRVGKDRHTLKTPRVKAPSKKAPGEP